MKKLVSVLLVLCLVGSLSCALAEAPGVTVISTGEEAEAEPISLADAKLNVPIELPNYGTLTLTSYDVWNWVTYAYNSWSNSDKWQSGNEADYIWLRFDILNDTYGTIDYYSDITSVQVIYNEKLVLEGWRMQYNYDSKDSYYSDMPSNSDSFPINAFYVGHFVVACTVPNAVLSDKTHPLKLVFVIGENEITYNIRK